MYSSVPAEPQGLKQAGVKGLSKGMPLVLRKELYMQAPGMAWIWPGLQHWKFVLLTS